MRRLRHPRGEAGRSKDPNTNSLYQKEKPTKIDATPHNIACNTATLQLQFTRLGLPALLSPELHDLRGGDQSEIVFGVLKIILRRDRMLPV